jgi:hypothetical protein
MIPKSPIPFGEGKKFVIQISGENPKFLKLYDKMWSKFEKVSKTKPPLGRFN